jgi:hypothetical protein
MLLHILFGRIVDPASPFLYGVLICTGYDANCRAAALPQSINAGAGDVLVVRPVSSFGVHNALGIGRGRFSSRCSAGTRVCMLLPQKEL